MPELALKLAGNGFVLVVAAIGWGLENKWRDRRTRVRRRWTQVLLATIIAGSIINGVITWHAHDQMQVQRERIVRIDQGVKELVKLGRERDPRLTEPEALNEVIEEVQNLRKRASELEGELQGVKRYSNVAELNALGLSGKIRPGSGLRETSAISLVLEEAYVRMELEGEERLLPRCDTIGVAAFKAAARLNPDFPFAHWALAVCAEKDRNPSWRTYAERAVTILEHTTQMAGHNQNHDEALEELRKLLRQ